MKGLRSRALGLVLALALLAALAGSLGALAHLAWWLELFAHFRPQYALVLTVCGVATMFLRRPVLGLAMLMLAAANGLPLLHYFGTSPAPAAEGPRLKAVLINLYHRNGSHDRALRYLRQSSADVVVLLEVTPAWREALRRLEDVLPYQAQAGGVLVAGRLPLAGLRALPLPSGGATAIVFDTTAGGSPLTVIGAHANWPLGRRISASRNRELAALAELARSVDGPLVVLADLNVTAFSPVFHSLLARGGLVDCAAGHGWNPTWPTWFPPLYMQIDHCLAGHGVHAARFATGPYVGSDHFPLEVTLRLAPAQPPAGGEVTASRAPPTFRR